MDLKPLAYSSLVNDVEPLGNRILPGIRNRLRVAMEHLAEGRAQAAAQRCRLQKLGTMHFQTYVDVNCFIIIPEVMPCVSESPSISSNGRTVDEWEIIWKQEAVT
jgi:hypothetical protein